MTVNEAIAFLLTVKAKAGGEAAFTPDKVETVSVHIPGELPLYFDCPKCKKEKRQ